MWFTSSLTILSGHKILARTVCRIRVTSPDLCGLFVVEFENAGDLPSCMRSRANASTWARAHIALPLTTLYVPRGAFQSKHCFTKRRRRTRHEPHMRFRDGKRLLDCIPVARCEISLDEIKKIWRRIKGITILMTKAYQEVSLVFNPSYADRPIGRSQLRRTAAV